MVRDSRFGCLLISAWYFLFNLFFSGRLVRERDREKIIVRAEVILRKSEGDKIFFHKKLCLGQNGLNELTNHIL